MPISLSTNSAFFYLLFQILPHYDLNKYFIRIFFIIQNKTDNFILGKFLNYCVKVTLFK